MSTGDRSGQCVLIKPGLRRTVSGTGSPCALALVPLAYACAIAAITARGILVKSGSAIDALAACKTIALDKTGTITTGSLNLAEGFVLCTATANPGSSSYGQDIPVHVRAMQGLAELVKKAVSGSSNSAGGILGTTTAFGSSGVPTRTGAVLDSDDFSLSGSLDDAAAEAGLMSAGGNSSSGGSGVVLGFDTQAIKCAVALSRLSNHPVSRAMVDSAPHMDGDVSVLSFEQVRKNRVYGICWMARLQSKG
jgi:hypothetical protein